MLNRFHRYSRFHTWLCTKAFVVICCLAAGLALRATHPDLFEYKYDQVFMFDQAQSVPQKDAWPTLGMKSGAELRNPPLSIWVFILLGKIFGSSSPQCLTNAVIVLNCLALALLGLWAFRQRSHRESWIWITAFVFAALNPIQIRYDRVIWAQSTLPLLSLIMLLSWQNRNRTVSAFFWGFLGALLGQIHMSGFFFSFALATWTFFFRDKAVPRTQWKAWLLGSLMGGLLMISWIAYILHSPNAGTSFHHPTIRFWSFWLSSPLGLDLREVIGSNHGLLNPHQAYFGYPTFFGWKTHLNLMAHWGSLFLGIAILIRGIRSFFGEKRRERIAILLGRSNDRTLAISATVIGMGVMLALAGVTIYRHYLIVTYPLSFLFVATLIDRAFTRKTATTIAIALAVFQLLMSISFHQYLSDHCGSPDGEFGTAYRCLLSAQK